MSDYDRIRVLWPDHLGLARGKYLPVRLAEQGTGHCVTTFALGYDRSLVPAPGAYLLEGLPDVVASFDADEVRPSWEDDTTGVVVGHLDFRGTALHSLGPLRPPAGHRGVGRTGLFAQGGHRV